MQISKMLVPVFDILLTAAVEANYAITVEIASGIPKLYSC